MAYLFVHAFHDLGVARGPRLGFVVHMAEGGGTVGFLSRANRDGVSVHYVIVYSGRIVRMLDEAHMHSSIRIHEPDGSSAIRLDDDPGGPYGRTAAVRVLGPWADTRTTLGPNQATLAVEIEGFAAAGPNAAQHGALRALTDDIRTRHPAVGLLGHRDFASYKACPGRLIEWAALGGHGGGDMQAAITDEAEKIVTAADAAVWYDLDNATRVGQSSGPLAARSSPYGVGSRRAIFATVAGHRRIVLVTPKTVAPIPPPVVDCTDAVTAELERAAVRAADAVRTRP